MFRTLYLFSSIRLAKLMIISVVSVVCGLCVKKESGTTAWFRFFPASMVVWFLQGLGAFMGTAPCITIPILDSYP
jgi:hypothetical protein